MDLNTVGIEKLTAIRNAARAACALRKDQEATPTKFDAAARYTRQQLATALLVLFIEVLTTEPELWAAVEAVAEGDFDVLKKFI